MTTQFTDLLVDTGNPAMLDKTVMSFGAVLIGAPDYSRVDGHYVMRVFGSPDFIRFACEHQGYCKIVGETDALKVKL